MGKCNYSDGVGISGGQILINLQQLIDTPGYGNAEKALRKAGKWELTPQEKMEECMNRLGDAIDDAHVYFDDVYAAMGATQ